MKKRASKKDLTRRVQEAVIPDDPNILLNEFQLAKLRGCSVFKLRRDRWAGGGVPYLKINGMVRYRRNDNEKFQETCLRRSTSDTPTHMVRANRPGGGGATAAVLPVSKTVPLKGVFPSVSGSQGGAGQAASEEV